MPITTGTRSGTCTSMLCIFLLNSAPIPHALKKSSSAEFTPAPVAKLLLQCVRGDKSEEVNQIANQAC